MERRRFLVKAGGGLMAAGAAAVASPGPYVHAQPRFSWRMATSYTPALDVLQGNAVRFARIVEQMSDGRMKIQVFAAGELVPAFGVFDAVYQGTLEMYSATPYFWAGKEPGLQWFSAVPFGLNAQGQYAWLYHGGGQKLWEEAYAPFNLVPRPGGSTGVQMGGWFKKKINSLADYKGLKFRIPGLGGKVISKAGATVVLLPPGEIFPALERGVVDGAEWIGPHDDMKLGFHNAAKYYYYPGWHEPSTINELTFNKKAYDALPSDFKGVLDYAAGYCSILNLSEYETRNNAAVVELRTKYKGKVEILPFPADVMQEFRKLAREVLEEEARRSPMAKRAHDSFSKFQASINDWAAISEDSYYRFIRG